MVEADEFPESPFKNRILAGKVALITGLQCLISALACHPKILVDCTNLNRIMPCALAFRFTKSVAQVLLVFRVISFTDRRPPQL